MTRCCAPRSPCRAWIPSRRAPRCRPAGAVEGPGAVRRARRAQGVRAGRGRAGAELGTGQRGPRMEVAAFDGTSRRARTPMTSWTHAFGVPAGGRTPMLRLVALVRTTTHRSAAAAIGGYHDGGTPSAAARSTLGPRHAQPRRPRLLLHGPVPAVSATAARLCWRRQGRREVRPGQDAEALPERLELVMLHSRTACARHATARYGRQTAGPAPRTRVARLVSRRA